MEAWLQAFSQTGNATLAARAAGIDRDTPYKHREKWPDGDFARRWEEAEEVASDLLEAEALRRARGYDQPVYGPIYDGGRVVSYGKVGSLQRASDTLLIFLLKSRRPEVFRERHDVTLGGRIIVESEVDAALRKAWEDHLALAAAPQEPRRPSPDPGQGAAGGVEPLPPVGP